MVLLTLLSAVAAAVAPPFPDRPPDVHLVDDAELINRLPEQGLDVGLEAYQERAGIDIAVYIQTKPAANERAEADADAQALLEQWQVGGADGNGLAMVWDIDRESTRAVVGIAVGDGLGAARRRRTAYRRSCTRRWPIARGRTTGSRPSTRASSRSPRAIPGATPARPRRPRGSTAPRTPAHARTRLARTSPSPPAGPPYPAAIPGCRVYDYADVLPRPRASAPHPPSRRIEDRTGAEVIVYTQVKPESDTPQEAERDADRAHRPVRRRTRGLR